VKSVRIEADVIFEFPPQELADLRPPSPGAKFAQQGSDQAVVLVRWDMAAADRVPLVEQVSEVSDRSFPLPLVHGVIVAGE